MAGSTNDDPAWILLILLCIFGLIGWAVWYFFEPQLLQGIRYVRIVEMAGVSLVDSRGSACLSWLIDARVAPPTEMPSREAYNAALACFGTDALLKAPTAEAMKYYHITGESLGLVGSFVGHYMRWLLWIMAGVLSYIALYKSKRNKFKTRHNLESFIKTQAEMWPVIKPIADFNPSKTSARILGQAVPDNIPIFAEAFAPEEWLSFHRIAVVNGVPDRESVRRAFLKQLGPRWTGFDDLPPYIAVLCAAFALKGVQKRDECDNFLGKISTFWTAKGGFAPSGELLSETRKLLKDPEIGGKALEVANKHAYRTTAVLGLLKWARFMGGVTASAHFLWVRGVDRELWYALNNLGRRTFHTEGAGAIAHFMAEDLAQKALPTPRLDTAIVTLNIYMGGDSPVQVPPREEPAGARG